MRPNPVLRAWREGRQTIGGWLTIPSALAIESGLAWCRSSLFLFLYFHLQISFYIIYVVSFFECLGWIANSNHSYLSASIGSSREARTAG